MPIYCVKSVKIYTGQKNLHGRRPWRPWQIWGMIVMHLYCVVVMCKYCVCDILINNYWQEVYLQLLQFFPWLQQAKNCNHSASSFANFDLLSSEVFAVYAIFTQSYWLTALIRGISRLLTLKHFHIEGKQLQRNANVASFLSRLCL